MRRLLLVFFICLGLIVSSGMAFADTKTGGLSIGIKTSSQNESVEEIYNGLVFVGYPVTDRIKVGIYVSVAVNRNKNNLQTNLNINPDTPIFGFQMRF